MSVAIETQTAYRRDFGRLCKGLTGIAWMHNAGNLHDVKDAGIMVYGTGNKNYAIKAMRSGC